jgi:hypothetical protein
MPVTENNMGIIESTILTCFHSNSARTAAADAPTASTAATEPGSPTASPTAVAASPSHPPSPPVATAAWLLARGHTPPHRKNLADLAPEVLHKIGMASGNVETVRTLKQVSKCFRSSLSHLLPPDLERLGLPADFPSEITSLNEVDRSFMMAHEWMTAPFYESGTRTWNPAASKALPRSSYLAPGFKIIIVSRLMKMTSPRERETLDGIAVESFSLGGCGFAEVLDLLATDDGLRVWVALNRHTSDKTLQHLADSRDPAVPRCMAQNPATPSQILWDLANNQALAVQIAGNPNAPPDLLGPLGQFATGQREVRRSLAATPKPRPNHSSASPMTRSGRCFAPSRQTRTHQPPPCGASHRTPCRRRKRASPQIPTLRAARYLPECEILKSGPPSINGLPFDRFLIGAGLGSPGRRHRASTMVRPSMKFKWSLSRRYWRARRRSSLDSAAGLASAPPSLTKSTNASPLPSAVSQRCLIGAQPPQKSNSISA